MAEIKKMLVAIPTSGIQYSEFALSLRMLRIPENCQVAFAMLKNTTLDAAHNHVAHAMPGDTDYVLYLDENVLIPPDALEKLIEHDKDVVSGLYFRNTYPYTPMVFKSNNDKKYDPILDYDDDKLMEVDACGAGCLLVKTEVFKKLKLPYFKSNEVEGGLPEDHYFCKKLRDAGFKIHCDTSVKCSHMSAGPIDSRTWVNIKEKVKAEKKN